MCYMRVIIFDLNGVFIVSPKLSDRFREDFGVDVTEFLVVLKDVMATVRLPEAESVYLLWKPHLEKWSISMTEQEFFGYWFDAEKENTEMTDLAKSLKMNGIRLFILSNNFKERSEYYDKNFPFLREFFEKVYYSWQTGYVKPDERCYKLILEENGLKPEECLYFDDSEQNIEVAKTLGLNGYIFENVEQVRRLVKPH